MLNSILQHFYIVGTASSIVIGLLLSLVIFNINRNKNQLLNLLCFILLTFSLSTTANSLIATYFVKLQPRTHSLSEPFQLLIGPLYYFYLCNLCKIKLAGFKLVLHLFPFVIILIFLSLAINQRFYLGQINWMALAVYVQIWFYYFICRLLLKKYREQLKKSCSSIDRINEAWIEQSLFALLLGYSALSIVYALNHGIYYVPINKSIAVILAVVTYFIVYKILSRPEIFAKFTSSPSVNHDEFLIVQSNNTINEGRDRTNNKYQKSSLSNEQIVNTYQLLQKYMDKEKPYIDPELNLQSLAEQLQISSHHLSQVINHEQSNNFYDLINSYRINEVKKQLTDPNNNDNSILSIAFSAGFNSKATFNRIFKNNAGQTPSEYRKSSANPDKN